MTIRTVYFSLDIFLVRRHRNLYDVKNLIEYNLLAVHYCIFIEAHAFESTLNIEANVPILVLFIFGFCIFNFILYIREINGM